MPGSRALSGGREYVLVDTWPAGNGRALKVEFFVEWLRMQHSKYSGSRYLIMVVARDAGESEWYPARVAETGKHSFVIILTAYLSGRNLVGEKLRTEP